VKTDHLLVEKQNGIARLTLNRPEARNALSKELKEGLVNTMLEVENDDSIRCVVIFGSGKDFMSGGDVKSFVELFDLTPDQRTAHFEQRINVLHPLLLSMQRMKKPIVAAVHGSAVGFGLSLALACDFVVATSDARFACSYVKIGVSPDGSGSYYLPRLVGVKRAMEIAMLGDFIDAETAKSMGLINRIVNPDQLEEQTQALLKRLISSPACALGNIKQLMYAAPDNSLESQMALEAKYFAQCTATDDWVEGVSAFVEKRKAKFGVK
jgi:2-(1,2-epoxy-1,2-dihydrophenyl)acetyl-CoA isomerase